MPRLVLTFDDGPGPSTPALLDVLAAAGVTATFFVLGVNLEKRRDIAVRAAREGHELGNHTYSHPYLPLKSHVRVEAELVATDAAIERATGIVPTIARPPWGGRRPSTVRAFERHAKKTVLWDVNSYDWKDLPPIEVAQRVVERARNGSIILMHDGGRDHTGTIEAVKLVVPELRARGFELVTVSQALAA